MNRAAPKQNTSLDSLVKTGWVFVAPGVMERRGNSPAPTVAVDVAKPKRDLKFLERRFLQEFEAAGGDPSSLTPEYKFHPTRRFRADFYHEATKTLIEVEGGLYGFRSKDKATGAIGGRHNNAEGYTKDAEKYNCASALGYRLFRLTSKMLTQDYMRQIVEWLNPKSE